MCCSLRPLVRPRYAEPEPQTGIGNSLLHIAQLRARGGRAMLQIQKHGFYVAQQNCGIAVVLLFRGLAIKPVLGNQIFNITVIGGGESGIVQNVSEQD
jgi:hypothetical protein